MLKTNHGSYNRLYLTSFVEMKSPHSGRVRRIKGFEHVPPKNVKIQIKQRADVAMDWHSRKSSPDHVWEYFLSWTFTCVFPFLSVAENAYLPKGNRNFSAALKLLPWCNQSKNINNNHLFHGNITRIKLENLAVVEKHFIPSSILPLHTTDWVETHVTCCCSCYGKQLFSLQHREQYKVAEVLLRVSLLLLDLADIL